MAQVGLDLDGTVAGYAKQLHEVARLHEIIKHHKYIEPTTYGMIEKGWFNTSEEFLQAHKLLCSEGDGIARLGVMENDLNEAIKKLQEDGHTITVVTARFMRDHDKSLRKKVEQDTYRWVERHLPSVNDVAVVFGGEKHKIGADIYIDDSPREINNLAKEGKKTLVYDQKYNKEVQGHQRIFSIHHVRKALKEMSMMS